MAAFLLWNVDGKPLDGLVQNLVRQHQIDVVLLVEYAFGSSLLPDLLAADGLYRRKSLDRFGVFARGDFNLELLRYRLGKRVGCWRWISPSGRRGLVVLLHGLDRNHHDDSTRRVFFRRVADAVRRDEFRKSHSCSLIAGDFNSEPFESAIVASDGLHALGSRTVRSRSFRRVRESGTATDFFYNPMWRAYGHREHPDSGAASYHWSKGWAHELGWHMVDQVVIRPGESGRFPEERLRIVTQVGAIDLLNPLGLPDRQTASDHLPIVFHWDL